MSTPTNPPVPNYNRSDIITAMARTIEVLSYMAWCDAWDEADAPDNRPEDCVSAGPGEDWHDIAPELDLGEQEDAGISWRDEAAILYGRLWQSWDVDPWLILASNGIVSSADAEKWAHYAVMSLVGHWVSWEDDRDPLAWAGKPLSLDAVSVDVPDYPGEWPMTEGA